MMEYVHAFHFLRPWWLMCILVLPVLPRLLRRTDGSASLERLVDAPLLPHLIKGSGTARLGPVTGIMLAWVLACMALAGPTWERLPQPVYTAQRAQVIAVSLSRRMLATDMLPNRMTRVRYKIHALLKANKDGQNALVAYAGAAFTVAPLTSDAGALTDLLDALSPDTMPVQGDNASAGIRRATRLLEEAGIKQGSIVLIDDHADQDAVRAARAAKAAGMRVSVLGVGTQKGAPVARDGGGFEKGPDGKVVMAARDDASLRAVASAGGGLYVRMQPDSKDVAALTSQLRTGAASRDSRQKVQVWRDQGPWLLLLVLPLAALAFRRGVLFLLPFIVLAPLFSAPAHAGGWSDAWHTRDQQAARALAHNQPKLAMKLASDPALRGTAAYRAGDYRDAARAFARAPGAQNQYNLGNALARMHRYNQAIHAYDRALSMDPGLSDARANRKSLQEWLRRHKPKSGHDSRKDHQTGRGGGASSNSSSSRKSGKPEAGKHHAQPHNASAPPSNSASGVSHGAPSDKERSSHGQEGVKPPSKADLTAQAKAREAQKKRMDEALGHASSVDKPYVLGMQKPAARSSGKQLPEAMRQALQSVPDDPGSLLRKKFMLEYQRRMQRGDTQDNGQQDGSEGQ